MGKVVDVQQEIWGSWCVKKVEKGVFLAVERPCCSLCKHLLKGFLMEKYAPTTILNGCDQAIRLFNIDYINKDEVEMERIYDRKHVA
jgi:hypothetical protein